MTEIGVTERLPRRQSKNPARERNRYREDPNRRFSAALGNDAFGIDHGMTLDRLDPKSS
jgi:hypothetical protein